VYLSNRTQLKPNSDKTPYELWKGIHASIIHFKVFGRKCFIKRNEKNPGKFDSRVDEGILLGYLARSKGYKCYDKKTKRVKYYIGVVVDEIASQPESSK